MTMCANFSRSVFCFPSLPAGLRWMHIYATCRTPTHLQGLSCILLCAGVQCTFADLKAY